MEVNTPYHWSEPILSQFDGQPERPMRKVPFQKMVIDKNNDIFRFVIRDKKAKYKFFASVCSANA